MYGYQIGLSYSNLNLDYFLSNIKCPFFSAPLSQMWRRRLRGLLDAKIPSALAVVEAHSGL